MQENFYSAERVQGGINKNVNNRFGEILCSVGNSGPKCATLCCLSLDRPLKPYDLWKKFKGDTGWDEINRSTLEGYLKYGMISAGLVAEDDAGFRLTGLGIVAQAYAKHQLQESVDFPYPLNKIFGHSNTNTKNRTKAPENRALILELSASGQTLRLIDVARELGISPGVISNNLRFLTDINLGKEGERVVALVEYESTNPEIPGFAQYVLKEGVSPAQAETVNKRALLTKAVAEMLFECQELDAATASTFLKQQFPEAGSRYLRNAASVILCGLVEQCYCDPLPFTGGKNQSELKITDLGREVVRRFVKPLRILLAGEENLLKEWQEIPWQEYAYSTIKKHYQEYTQATSKRKDDVVIDVFNTVKRYPGIRPCDVRRELGITTEEAAIRELLKEPAAIRKKRDGRKVFLYPIE